MTLSTIQTTIRLALVTLLSLTVVVACGPDKHKHRMPMKTGQQKGINPKTGLGNTPQQTAEQQKKQAEDLKNRSQKIEEIDGLIAAAKDPKKFNSLDKNSLKEGIYTLDKVIVYFKYMNAPDDVRVYREHGIQNYRLTDLTYKATGFVASFSDNPRFVEVPLKFIVDRSQNQDWTAAGGAAFPQVVNMRSEAKQNPKEYTLDLLDDNQDIDANNRLKTSVGNMLVSAQFANGAYTIQDENGKNVTMRLLDVSETRLNISFDIDEAGPKPLRARTIVLSYAIEKKVAAQSAGTPAASAAATTQDGQLAPENASAPGDNRATPADAVPGVDDDQAQH
jgi:hypothetical protein